MMGTGSGARPAAASRERKQPKAAPAPAGRRGGAGSWNKSQEGLPGSSWSGLQRMEAGNGKGEGGRGMRRGFLRPRPRSSCAGGPGTSATLAQHCHADMGAWRLCVASGVTCGWHRERGSGWSPSPARAGAAQVWGSWSLLGAQPDLRCPCLPSSLACQSARLGAADSGVPAVPRPPHHSSAGSPAAPRRPGSAVSCVVPAGWGRPGALMCSAAGQPLLSAKQPPPGCPPGRAEPRQHHMAEAAVTAPRAPFPELRWK